MQDADKAVEALSDHRGIDLFRCSTLISLTNERVQNALADILLADELEPVPKPAVAALASDLPLDDPSETRDQPVSQATSPWTQLGTSKPLIRQVVSTEGFVFVPELAKSEGPTEEINGPDRSTHSDHGADGTRASWQRRPEKSQDDTSSSSNDANEVDALLEDPDRLRKRGLVRYRVVAALCTHGLIVVRFDRLPTSSDDSRVDASQIDLQSPQFRVVTFGRRTESSPTTIAFSRGYSGTITSLNHHFAQQLKASYPNDAQLGQEQLPPTVGLPRPITSVPSTSHTAPSPAARLYGGMWLTCACSNGEVYVLPLPWLLAVSFYSEAAGVDAESFATPISFIDAQGALQLRWTSRLTIQGDAIEGDEDNDEEETDDASIETATSDQELEDDEDGQSDLPGLTLREAFDETREDATGTTAATTTTTTAVTRQRRQSDVDYRIPPSTKSQNAPLAPIMKVTKRLVTPKLKNGPSKATGGTPPVLKSTSLLDMFDAYRKSRFVASTQPLGFAKSSLATRTAAASDAVQGESNGSNAAYIVGRLYQLATEKLTDFRRTGLIGAFSSAPKLAPFHRPHLLLKGSRRATKADEEQAIAASMRPVKREVDPLTEWTSVVWWSSFAGEDYIALGSTGGCVTIAHVATRVTVTKVLPGLTTKAPAQSTGVGGTDTFVHANEKPQYTPSAVYALELVENDEILACPQCRVARENLFSIHLTQRGVTANSTDPTARPTDVSSGLFSAPICTNAGRILGKASPIEPIPIDPCCVLCVKLHAERRQTQHLIIHTRAQVQGASSTSGEESSMGASWKDGLVLTRTWTLLLERRALMKPALRDALMSMTQQQWRSRLCELAAYYLALDEHRTRWRAQATVAAALAQASSEIPTPTRIARPPEKSRRILGTERVLALAFSFIYEGICDVSIRKWRQQRLLRSHSPVIPPNHAFAPPYALFNPIATLSPTLVRPPALLLAKGTSALIRFAACTEARSRGATSYSAGDVAVAQVALNRIAFTSNPPFVAANMVDPDDGEDVDFIEGENMESSGSAAETVSSTTVSATSRATRRSSVTTVSSAQPSSVWEWEPICDGGDASIAGDLGFSGPSVALEDVRTMLTHEFLQPGSGEPEDRVLTVPFVYDPTEAPFVGTSGPAPRLYRMSLGGSTSDTQSNNPPLHSSLTASSSGSGVVGSASATGTGSLVRLTPSVTYYTLGASRVSPFKPDEPAPQAQPRSTSTHNLPSILPLPTLGEISIEHVSSQCCARHRLSYANWVAVKLRIVCHSQGGDSLDIAVTTPAYGGLPFALAPGQEPDDTLVAELGAELALVSERELDIQGLDCSGPAPGTPAPILPSNARVNLHAIATKASSAASAVWSVSESLGNLDAGGSGAVSLACITGVVNALTSQPTQRAVISPAIASGAAAGAVVPIGLTTLDHQDSDDSGALTTLLPFPPPLLNATPTDVESAADAVLQSYFSSLKQAAIKRIQAAANAAESYLTVAGPGNQNEFLTTPSVNFDMLSTKSTAHDDTSASLSLPVPLLGPTVQQTLAVDTRVTDHALSVMQLAPTVLLFEPCPLISLDEIASRGRGAVQSSTLSQFHSLVQQLGRGATFTRMVPVRSGQAGTTGSDQPRGVLLAFEAKPEGILSGTTRFRMAVCGSSSDASLPKQALLADKFVFYLESGLHTSRLVVCSTNAARAAYDTHFERAGKTHRLKSQAVGMTSNDARVQIVGLPRRVVEASSVTPLHTGAWFLPLAHQEALTIAACKRLASESNLVMFNKVSGTAGSPTMFTPWSDVGAALLALAKSGVSGDVAIAPSVLLRGSQDVYIVEPDVKRLSQKIEKTLCEPNPDFDLAAQLVELGTRAIGVSSAEDGLGLRDHALRFATGFDVSVRSEARVMRALLGCAVQLTTTKSKKTDSSLGSVEDNRLVVPSWYSSQKMGVSKVPQLRHLHLRYNVLQVCPELAPLLHGKVFDLSFELLALRRSSFQGKIAASLLASQPSYQPAAFERLDPLNSDVNAEAMYEKAAWKVLFMAETEMLTLFSQHFLWQQQFECEQARLEQITQELSTQVIDPNRVQAVLSATSILKSLATKLSADVAATTRKCMALYSHGVSLARRSRLTHIPTAVLLFFVEQIHLLVLLARHRDRQVSSGSGFAGLTTMALQFVTQMAELIVRIIDEEVLAKLSAAYMALTARLQFNQVQSSVKSRTSSESPLKQQQQLQQALAKVQSLVLQTSRIQSQFTYAPKFFLSKLLSDALYLGLSVRVRAPMATAAAMALDIISSSSSVSGTSPVLSPRASTSSPSHKAQNSAEEVLLSILGLDMTQLDLGTTDSKPSSSKSKPKQHRSCVTSRRGSEQIIAAKILSFLPGVPPQLPSNPAGEEVLESPSSLDRPRVHSSPAIAALMESGLLESQRTASEPETYALTPSAVTSGVESAADARVATLRSHGELDSLPATKLSGILGMPTSSRAFKSQQTSDDEDGEEDEEDSEDLGSSLSTSEVDVSHAQQLDATDSATASDDRIPSPANHSIAMTAGTSFGSDTAPASMSGASESGKSQGSAPANKGSRSTLSRTVTTNKNRLISQPFAFPLPQVPVIGDIGGLAPGHLAHRTSALLFLPPVPEGTYLSLSLLTSTHDFTEAARALAALRCSLVSRLVHAANVEVERLERELYQVVNPILSRVISLRSAMVAASKHFIDEDNHALLKLVNASERGWRARKVMLEAHSNALRHYSQESLTSLVSFYNALVSASFARMQMTRAPPKAHSKLTPCDYLELTESTSPDLIVTIHSLLMKFVRDPLAYPPLMENLTRSAALSVNIQKAFLASMVREGLVANSRLHQLLQQIAPEMNKPGRNSPALVGAVDEIGSRHVKLRERLIQYALKQMNLASEFVFDLNGTREQGHIAALTMARQQAIEDRPGIGPSTAVVRPGSLCISCLSECASSSRHQAYADILDFWRTNQLLTSTVLSSLTRTTLDQPDQLWLILLQLKLRSDIAAEALSILASEDATRTHALVKAMVQREKEIAHAMWLRRAGIETNRPVRVNSSQSSTSSLGASTFSSNLALENAGLGLCTKCARGQQHCSFIVASGGSSEASSTRWFSALADVEDHIFAKHVQAFGQVDKYETLRLESHASSHRGIEESARPEGGSHVLDLVYMGGSSYQASQAYSRAVSVVRELTRNSAAACGARRAASTITANVQRISTLREAMNETLRFIPDPSVEDVCDLSSRRTVKHAHPRNVLRDGVARIEPVALTASRLDFATSSSVPLYAGVTLLPLFQSELHSQDAQDGIASRETPLVGVGALQTAFQYQPVPSARGQANPAHARGDAIQEALEGRLAVREAIEAIENRLAALATLSGATELVRVIESLALTSWSVASNLTLSAPAASSLSQPYSRALKSLISATHSLDPGVSWVKLDGTSYRNGSQRIASASPSLTMGSIRNHVLLTLYCPNRLGAIASCTSNFHTLSSFSLVRLSQDYYLGQLQRAKHCPDTLARCAQGISSDPTDDEESVLLRALGCHDVIDIPADRPVGIVWKASKRLMLPRVDGDDRSGASENITRGANASERFDLQEEESGDPDLKDFVFISRSIKQETLEQPQGTDSMTVSRRSPRVQTPALVHALATEAFLQNCMILALQSASATQSSLGIEHPHPFTNDMLYLSLAQLSPLYRPSVVRSLAMRVGHARAAAIVSRLMGDIVGAFEVSVTDALRHFIDSFSRLLNLVCRREQEGTTSFNRSLEIAELILADLYKAIFADVAEALGHILAETNPNPTADLNGFDIPSSAVRCIRALLEVSLFAAQMCATVVSYARSQQSSENMASHFSSSLARGFFAPVLEFLLLLTVPIASPSSDVGLSPLSNVSELSSEEHQNQRTSRWSSLGPLPLLVSQRTWLDSPTQITEPRLKLLVILAAFILAPGCNDAGIVKEKSETPDFDAIISLRSTLSNLQCAEDFISLRQGLQSALARINVDIHGTPECSFVAHLVPEGHPLALAAAWALGLGTLETTSVDYDFNDGHQTIGAVHWEPLEGFSPKGSSQIQLEVQQFAGFAEKLWRVHFESQQDSARLAWLNRVVKDAGIAKFLPEGGHDASSKVEGQPLQPAKLVTQLSSDVMSLETSLQALFLRSVSSSHRALVIGKVCAESSRGDELMDEIADDNVDEDAESRLVVFECGHSFTQRAFLRDELLPLLRRLSTKVEVKSTTQTQQHLPDRIARWVVLPSTVKLAELYGVHLQSVETYGGETTQPTSSQMPKLYALDYRTLIRSCGSPKSSRVKPLFSMCPHCLEASDADVRSALQATAEIQAQLDEQVAAQERWLSPLFDMSSQQQHSGESSSKDSTTVGSPLVGLGGLGL